MERERENIPALPDCSQNKGLSKYQRRASQLWTGPSPTRGREAGELQPELEKGNLSPRNILHQTVSRLPVANQVFLGSWTVDIHQEGHRQRLAPQRRHMAHLRWHSRVAGTREVIRCTAQLGRVCWPSTWSARLLGPGKGTKRRPN